MGASLGGGASERAAVDARPGEIDWLALLSPAPIPNPEALHAGRILYIASRDEPIAPAVEEQFQRAPDSKRREMLEGDAHAQHIFRTDKGPVTDGAHRRVHGQPVASASASDEAQGRAHARARRQAAGRPESDPRWRRL